MCTLNILSEISPSFEKSFLPFATKAIEILLRAFFIFENRCNLFSFYIERSITIKSHNYFKEYPIHLLP